MCIYSHLFNPFIEPATNIVSTFNMPSNTTSFVNSKNPITSWLTDKLK